MKYRIFWGAMLPLFITCLHAAPLELDILRQQYDKIITEPFEEGKVGLETKYRTALEAAAKTAQQAGKLDDVVALTQEQKRLADKLPIPDEQEGVPEALVNLRDIYHEQFARLVAEQEAAKAKVLPAYVDKLKELESQLTKGDRIPDALAVKSYREGLGRGDTAAPAAMTTGTMPVAEDSAPTPVPSSVPKLKGDDRKAAEWILANWNEHRIFVGSTQIKGAADLPGGRFELTSISLDGRYCKDGFVSDGAAFQEHLSGLAGIESLNLGSFESIGDADLAFVATLGSLEALALRNMPGITDGVLHYFVGLKALKKLNMSEIKEFSGAELDQLTGLPIEELGFFKCRTDDAGVAGLAGFRKLRVLALNGENISDVSLETIKSLPALEHLFISSTDFTPEGLANADLKKVTNLSCNRISQKPLTEIVPVVASTFPNVVAFQLGYDVRTPEEISALARFPKLRYLSHSANVLETAWPGLLELRNLEIFMNYSDVTPLPDICLEVLSKLKKLKIVELGASPPSPAALAAFKSARPDVEIKN